MGARAGCGTYFQGDPSHYDPPPKPPLTPYEAIMERGDPSALCVLP